jgi:hypothetical protein
MHMKTNLLKLFIVLTVFLMTPFPGSTKGIELEDPYVGMPVCLSDVHTSALGKCLPMGPSPILSDYARSGNAYPARPLPAEKPPSELTRSPVFLAKINLEPTLPVPLYATLEDAVAQANPVRWIAPGHGLRYVSYIREERFEGKAYVLIKSGEWVRAAPAGSSDFQGLLFSGTPSTGFGWMIDSVPAREAPSFTAREVGEPLPRHTPITIYRVEEFDGMEWYLIGPDQWVPYLKARRARVDTTPPEGVTGDRWIAVDLYDQVVMVYENRQLVFATLVSTGGDPFFTQPGLFQIYQKKELETMSGAFEPDKSDYYYLEDVPWTMYYDQARALHGAYWRSWFGVAATHGCVNFSLGDAQWLFNWANEGDWVYVWDASGQTPTDPNYYGAGGA